MLQEAAERYIAHGRWNAYNRADVERVAKLPENEKSEAISEIRVTADGQRLSDKQKSDVEEFVGAVLDAMCIAEAREESDKLFDDLAKYLIQRRREGE
jgi:hypothetical protein